MTKTKSFESFNELDLAILVGMLLTDGSVNVSGSHKNIAFTNRSEVLHKIFKEKMRNLFGIVKFQEWKDKRWRNVKTTFLRSPEIYEWLQKLTPSYRTKPELDGKFPPSRIPNFVLKLKPKEIAEVLRIMFSTDGCVCLGASWSKSDEMWQIRRLIKFSCLHPIIKEQVSELLRKLGIAHKADEEGIIIWKENDIRAFHQNVGFVNGVKVTRNSKVWEGFEKNHVLKLLIKTFSLKKRDLQKFKTKDEVVGFLKKLVIN